MPPSPPETTPGPGRCGRPAGPGPALRRRGISAGRALAALLSVLLLAAAGCGRTPRFDPGCYMGRSVPVAVSRAVLQASDRFYALLRSHSYDTAWEEASDQLRGKFDKERLATAWGSMAEVLTIPEGLKFEELAIVAIEEGTRGPQELACSDPADTLSRRRVVVTDQPLQAYLIQTGTVQGTSYSFGTVWFFEEGQWKIATVGVRPREARGHDWQYYHQLARSEREAGHKRNAALLYNLTMELLVPAPWILPDMLDVLQQEQRRLRVQNLPNNRKERWVAADSTEFWPYRSSVELVERGLAVKFFYEVPEPIDSLAVITNAPKLAEFVRVTFPEYREVFDTVLLEAVTPVEHRPLWSGQFPLR